MTGARPGQLHAAPLTARNPPRSRQGQQRKTTGPQIVVGVYGSEPSRLALQWGAFLAAPVGATVDAFIAWQLPATYGWAATQWDPCTEMTGVLNESVHAVFGDRPPVPIRAQAREGGAARVLIEASHGAHMLVVGSRGGHGGFVGLLIGSVSARVAEHAACPVLVVHGDQGPHGAPREQAVQGGRPARGRGPHRWADPVRSGCGPEADGDPAAVWMGCRTPPVPTAWPRPVHVPPAQSQQVPDRLWMTDTATIA